MSTRLGSKSCVVSSMSSASCLSQCRRLATSSPSSTSSTLLLRRSVRVTQSPALDQSTASRCCSSLLHMTAATARQRPRLEAAAATGSLAARSMSSTTASQPPSDKAPPSKKGLDEVVQEANKSYEVVDEQVVPNVMKAWVSRKLKQPQQQKKMTVPDFQHLPTYHKADARIYLASSPTELEQLLNEHFIPLLVPFCPPEIRSKENVTSQDVLDVFEKATTPLITEPDSEGRYRPCVAGLDTEGGCVVLIQLSIGDCSIIYRSWALCKFPDNFKILLKSKGLLKLGVGIDGDAINIFKHHKQELLGCVDLRNIAHVVSVISGKSIHGGSLQVLAGQFIEAKLSKMYQQSEWGRDELSEGQIHYAAHDAMVGEDIFNSMKECLDGAGVTRDQLARILGQFSDSRRIAAITPDATVNVAHPVSAEEALELTTSSSSAAPLRTSAHTATPAVTAGKITDAAVDAACSASDARRISSGYDNCRMFNKDGEFLANVNRKRVEWYLQRDLAVVLSGSKERGRLDIQLQLPSGTPAGNGEVEEFRQNRCVVCSNKSIAARHNVVPLVYRRHFPERLKSHMSHDIVLMCRACSQRYNFCVNRLIDYFDVHYGLNVGESRQQMSDATVQPKAARAAGRALLIHNKGQFSAGKVQTLTETIAKYYDIKEEDVNKEVQRKAMEIALSDFIGSSTENGRLIADKLQETGDYAFEKFIIKCRRYFVDIMAPRYLPSNWSLTHGIEERLDLDDGNWKADGKLRKLEAAKEQSL